MEQNGELFTWESCGACGVIGSLLVAGAAALYCSLPLRGLAMLMFAQLRCHADGSDGLA